MVLSHLILFMALLPIKMGLRWTIQPEIFISIPEYFLIFNPRRPQRDGSMPAVEQPWRDTKLLHRSSAQHSFVMLVATIWHVLRRTIIGNGNRFQRTATISKSR